MLQIELGITDPFKVSDLVFNIAQKYLSHKDKNFRLIMWRIRVESYNFNYDMSDCHGELSVKLY